MSVKHISVCICNTGQTSTQINVPAGIFVKINKRPVHNKARPVWEIYFQLVKIPGRLFGTRE